ncbi:MAG: DegV family protein [Dehalococcoidales bacterium]|jgi:DegV family protein with EDD domain|nr:DegV family protein [Dehalococcoidales bacterium]
MKNDRVVIITDSIACLTPDIVNRYRIIVVPINIHFNGTIYRDGVTLTTEEAYKILEKDPDDFASSPASIGEYFEVYQKAARETHDILVITISTRLSTMYNIARLAKEQARETMPDTRIEIFDSGTATIGEGLIVTAAARAADEGKSLEEIISLVNRVSAEVRVIGILDTVRYVYRTGRIPKISARLGSLLNIKPMFALARGEIHFMGITRNREKGIDQLIKTIKNEVDSRPLHLAIAHAQVPEEAQSLKTRIESEFNTVESWLTDFSPVMAYATGTGVLVAGYYAEPEI